MASAVGFAFCEPNSAMAWRRSGMCGMSRASPAALTTSSSDWQCL